jgi:hypothetical protein
MNEMLASPYVFVLGILLITVAVPVVCHYWYEYRKHESETALKHDMLQRGMSADEIKVVLEASSTPSKKPAKTCGVPTLTREPSENVRTRG